MPVSEKSLPVSVKLPVTGKRLSGGLDTPHYLPVSEKSLAVSGKRFLGRSNTLHCIMRVTGKLRVTRNRLSGRSGTVQVSEKMFFASQ